MFPALLSRPIRKSTVLLLLAAVMPAPAVAQRQTATLTLEEAIELARRNNPDFLIQQNDEAEADWAIREAYGALVPSASVGGSMQYQAPGSQRFGIFTAEDIGVGTTSGYLLSNYSVGLNYRIAGDILMRPGQERANRRATQARIEAAGFTLAAEVTRQYLAALRAQDAVVLARQELQRADENLKLAEARVSVGAAIALEAKQAEVERGRAEVELLRAESQKRAETLRLIQQIGIEFEREVELTSTFAVFAPTWSEDELIGFALDRHPQLRSLRATQDASDTAVKIARSQYLPTFDLSLGWSGFTREATNDHFLIDQYRSQIEDQMESCEFGNQLLSRLNPPLPEQDCSQFVASPAQEALIRERNNVFPFNFTKEPFSAQLRVSLPIFNGFVRERRIESARVASEDARYRLRKEELRLKTEVSTLRESLETAYKAVALEDRNRDLAADQLDLARERYSVGAVSFVDLLDAETIKARADRAYLVAVYTFHESLAALEAAVGQRLDQPAENR